MLVGIGAEQQQYNHASKYFEWNIPIREHVGICYSCREVMAMSDAGRHGVSLRIA
jgi:hypothetical protein